MHIKIILIAMLATLISCSSTTSEQDEVSDSLDVASEQMAGSDEALTEEDLLGLDEEIEEEFGEEFSESSEEEEFADGGESDDFEDEFAASDSEEESFEDEFEDGDFFAEEDFAEDELSEDSTGDAFAEDGSGEGDLVSDQNQEVDDFASEDSFAADDGFDDFSEDSFAASSSEGDDSFATTEPSSDSVNITGLDFLANENGGTIVINADGPTTYSTRTNPETNQFVVEVPNANLAKRFQRPYNTNEFGGAIGMFEAYQDAGSNTARFVVQLNADQEPLVEQDGDSIMIVASNLTEEPSAAMTAESEFTEEEYQEPEPEFEPAVDEQAVMQDQNILQDKSLEDFLSGNTKFYGRKINIEVKDWDVRDVFDFLAEQSGLNLVLSEEVKGQITLKLRDVPWDQALHVVMQAKQLGYKRQGSIVRIAPLASLRAESDNARRVIDSQRLLQPTQVKIIPVNYAKADKIEDQVKEFLTPNRGKVKADERTNALVVTDIPEVIQKVTRLVESLDTQTPQVLIEAKIIEARESLVKKMGVDWSAGSEVAGKDASAGASIAAAIDDAVGTLRFGKADSSFLASFSLLESEDMVKILSSPRILGLNNQTARIKQTNEIPIVEVNVTGDTATETITYVPLDLTLEVTPQVTSEGSIIMGLNLTREFAGEDDSGNRPLFKRNAQTNIIVNNGETAVVGGVYQNDTSEVENGVPYLSKIPILGYLFKSKSESSRKNELMMFITPRVINMDKAFAGDSTEEMMIDEQDDFL